MPATQVPSDLIGGSYRQRHFVQLRRLEFAGYRYDAAPTPGPRAAEWRVATGEYQNNRGCGGARAAKDAASSSAAPTSSRRETLAGGKVTFRPALGSAFGRGILRAQGDAESRRAAAPEVSRACGGGRK